MKQKRALLLLFLILLAGAIWRGLYLAEFVRNPAFRHPEVDALFHDYWARGLAFGDWEPPPGITAPDIQGQPYFRPPGYPFLLAGIYTLFGPGYIAPRIVHFILGLFSAVLVFILAGNLRGSRTGLMAALIYVSYWGFIYFEGELHAAAPAILLLLGSLCFLHACLSEQRRWMPFAAGFLLGLSALFRPNLLLLFAAFALWIFLYMRVRRALISSLLLAAGIAAAVAPTAYRNYRVSGDVVLISSNAGINFYIGNHEQATGLCVAEIPGYGDFGTCFDYPHVLAQWSARQGRPISHAHASSYFFRKGVQFIWCHPVRSAELLARKFLLFWGPREVSHNKAIAFERMDSFILRYLPVSFSMLLALAVGSWALMLMRPGRAVAVKFDRPMFCLLWLSALFYCVSIIPFFVAARYRIPVIPLLIPLGAAVIDEGVSAYKDGRKKMLWLLLTVTASVYVVVSFNYTGYRPSPYFWHMSRGLALGKGGRLEEAEEYFRKALNVRPRSWDAHVNLGVILERRGKQDEARRCYESAAYQADHPVALFNLGRMAEREGAWADAEYFYQRLVEVKPQYPGVRRHLAMARRMQMKRSAIYHPGEESAGHPEEEP